MKNYILVEIIKALPNPSSDFLNDFKISYDSLCTYSIFKGLFNATRFLEDLIIEPEILR